MQKEVLISNLEVLIKEVAKAEKHIGKEYGEVLAKCPKASIKEVTKEEFYYENILTVLLEAKEHLELAMGMISTQTPNSLVEIAESEGHDYKELSFELKQKIAIAKMSENPLLGLMSIVQALDLLKR